MAENAMLYQLEPFASVWVEEAESDPKTALYPDNYPQMDENTEMEETGKEKLRNWLNKSLKIEMTDGRTLIGVFLCTDRDRNVILGSCEEYLKPPDSSRKKEEPRILGLAMIPGRHIVSIHVDVDRGHTSGIM